MDPESRKEKCRTTGAGGKWRGACWKDYRWHVPREAALTDSYVQPLWRL